VTLTKNVVAAGIVTAGAGVVVLGTADAQFQRSVTCFQLCELLLSPRLSLPHHEPCLHPPPPTHPPTPCPSLPPSPNCTHSTGAATISTNAALTVTGAKLAASGGLFELGDVTMQRTGASVLTISNDVIAAGQMTAGSGTVILQVCASAPSR